MSLKLKVKLTNVRSEVLIGTVGHVEPLRSAGLIPRGLFGIGVVKFSTVSKKKKKIRNSPKSISTQILFVPVRIARTPGKELMRWPPRRIKS